jgi:hypothetical protein
VQEPPDAQATQDPAALQTIPVPHAVPACLLVLSMQTGEPVLHEFVPFLHGFAGWQAVPPVHETHIPERHTRLAPQVVPSAIEAAVSVQTATPVSQASVPLWHGLVGAQVVPAVQLTQAPLVQTLLVPHPVPAGALPTAMQTGAPLVHEMTPVLHGSEGWQMVPVAHETQAPAALQTLSVPHDVPLGSMLPLSAHETLGEQTVLPAWQAIAGVHARPSTHATQVPPLQTMLVPHVTPFGPLPDSIQTGAPTLQAVVPTRQGLSATWQLEFAAQATQAPDALQTLSVPQGVPAGTSVSASSH